MLFYIHMFPLSQSVWRFDWVVIIMWMISRYYLLMDGQQGTVPESLAENLEAMVGWLKQSWLKLNPLRMAVLWLNRVDFGLRCQLPTFNNVSITPVLIEKSLGVTLNSSLSLKAQVTSIARQAFLHQWPVRLKKLAPFLSHSDLAIVIHATVASRLDYCYLLHPEINLETSNGLD